MNNDENKNITVAEINLNTPVNTSSDNVGIYNLHLENIKIKNFVLPSVKFLCLPSPASTTMPSRRWSRLSFSKTLKLGSLFAHQVLKLVMFLINDDTMVASDGVKSLWELLG